MKRYHKELRILRRQFREGLTLGHTRSAGYYRKRDAHDCGRPRCGVCHREKRFGHALTRQEILAILRYNEQLVARRDDS
jgi:hypothetical protein